MQEKARLLAKVTAVLRRATALYSHSYERVGTWHPDSPQWVEQGCDPNQWVSIPQLVGDVRALRHGRAIVLPPSPVPCPGATRCRTALLCYACAVPMEPAAQLTIPVMSPHSQRVHGEDARKAGETAYHRLLQGGTARRGEQHSTDKSCKEYAASAWQAIPLESIRLLALVRCCHMR